MVSKLWKWEDGRQSSGYSKLLLATSKLLRFDVYLLRIHKGGQVPPHTDASKPGFEHHRINITLRAAHRGGDTYFDNFDTESWIPKPELAPRAYHFRPDLIEHQVTRVVVGEVWLLSIGWLRRKK